MKTFLNTNLPVPSIPVSLPLPAFVLFIDFYLSYKPLYRLWLNLLNFKHTVFHNTISISHDGTDNGMLEKIREHGKKMLK